MPFKAALLLSAVACGGCASAPVQPPQRPSTGNPTGGRFRTVHVDTVAPGREGEFEQARLSWLAALAAKQTSDARGVFLQVGGHTYFTLRPFFEFADLDSRGKARTQALAQVDPALRKRYDDKTDATLVFPHRNEIWSIEPSLAYQGLAGATTECRAGAARLVIESLRTAPPFESQYQSIWNEMRDALRKVSYPLSRITYSSTFGDGRLFSFWLSRNREDLAKAPTIEAALREALGPEKASALMRRQADCLVGSETLDVIPRPDLSNPEFCR